MEKRLVLAIILSVLVLFGFQAIFNKANKRPVTQETQTEITPPSPVPPAPGTAGKSGPKATPAVPGGQEAPAKEAPAPSAATDGQAETEVAVETSLYRAVWSNRGGVLKSWILKKHLNSEKEKAPLDLVPSLAAEIGRFPFSLAFDDAALAAELNSALFETSSASLDLADGASGELRFTYSDGEEIQAEKIFRFRDGSYALETEIRAWKNGQAISPSVLWGPGIGNPSDADMKQRFSSVRGSAVYTGGKVFRMNEKKFKAGENTYNFVDWAAYEESYFTALFVLPPRKGQAVFLEEATEGRDPIHFLYVTDPQKAFIGPKSIDDLKALGHDSKKVINFGKPFGGIAEVMLIAVKFFHGLAPNWGVAIILLTIVIKIIFFPLTYSSTKSMAKMADLQPKVKAIRMKYKKAKTDIDQRRQMNEEMMRLYKEQGVNPAGGCLPLLIQLPVFWGVFRMLVAAVEFRQAPFALWITDLSVKDPYLVTPILMGITQFISQKMTPTSADPSQAKMMLFMPFVMTIFFINFQSGLVLYWLTTNVLQIGQQALMNKMMHRHPITAKAR
jgi:YidC/Oxa1 family membrane protein insertase